jgi:ankyrin repeat protein
VAADPTMVEAKSIDGRSDMPLFEIIEILFKAKESQLNECQLKNGKEPVSFDKVVQSMLCASEQEMGQTPLHYAFKAGNIELVL